MKKTVYLAFCLFSVLSGTAQPPDPAKILAGQALLQSSPDSVTDPNLRRMNRQIAMGKQLEETGQAIQAIDSLEKALPLARRSGNESYASVLKYLAIAQKENGNNIAALRYYEEYIQVQDTLTREKLLLTAAGLDAGYKSYYQAQYRAQILASKEKDRLVTVKNTKTASPPVQGNVSNNGWLLVLVLATLGIISLLLYFIHRNKERSITALNLKNDQLDVLHRELVIANETKAKLFGIIGHDLRSPVSRIVQLLQLQKEKSGLPDEPSRGNYEEKIKTASENVLETMEDLLLWSKTQMQHFTPPFIPVDLSVVVQKELDFLLQRIIDKDLQVSNEVPVRFIQLTVENIVSVIIRNLLQNAAKYCDEAGTISIRGSGSDLRITNPSSLADAATLNALLHNREVDNKTSGLGFQIAHDLAASIHTEIVFTQSADGYLTAVLSWKN